MLIHTLKTWPAPFAAILAGRKCHEVRPADRPFAEGDWLRLREYDPGTDSYSGEELMVRVGYVSTPGTFGLPDNLVVMSIFRDAEAPAT